MSDCNEYRRGVRDALNVVREYDTGDLCREDELVRRIASRLEQIAETGEDKPEPLRLWPVAIIIAALALAWLVSTL